MSSRRWFEGALGLDGRAFDETGERLRAAGCELTGGEFQTEHFESWWLTGTCGGAAFRLVWDGRDRWLAIQLPDPTPDGDGWRDRWIEKAPEGQSPEQVVQQLFAILDGL